MKELQFSLVCPRKYSSTSSANEYILRCHLQYIFYEEVSSTDFSASRRFY